MARWFWVAWMWLMASFASAQSAPELAHQPRPSVNLQLLHGGPPVRPGRFARVSSIAGVVGAGLSLSAALTIALVPAQRDTERITRTVHFGFTALAAPWVAMAAWTARRRADDVPGAPRMRSFGWLFYTTALTVGVLDVFDAYHDYPRRPDRTIIQGSLAALALLSHSFDAYISARHARLRSLRLGLSPLGVYAQF